MLISDSKVVVQSRLSSWYLGTGNEFLSIRNQKELESLCIKSTLWDSRVLIYLIIKKAQKLYFGSSFETTFKN